MKFQILTVIFGSFAVYHMTAAFQGLSFDPDNFLCTKFGELCDNVLEEIGCSRNSSLRIIHGCPDDYLPEFSGANSCLCHDPVYYDASTRVVQQLIGNRITPDMTWMMEPWNSGPPYDIKLSYKNICDKMLGRIGCPEANQTIVAEDNTLVNGVKTTDFKCSCGLLTAGDSLINVFIMDKLNDYDLRSTPIFSNPIYLSVPMSMVAILICGKLGAIVAVYLKLPPIIGFMMGGFAIQNIINPMFLKGAGFPYPSPASEIKLIALIIVLMRSGLSIKFDELKATCTVSSVFSWLPFFVEFFLWVYIGGTFFHWSTIDMGLLAAVMAPLGPSVVLSGLLSMVANTKKNFGYVPKQMIITTPIEAVIAIVLFGIFADLEQASGNPLYPWVESMPLWLTCVLIPVNLLFSIVMGIVLGWLCSKYINWRAKIKTDFIWVRVSKNPQMGSSTADLVYVLVVACYCMYSLCSSQYIQQSSGVLVVFVCCITVSKLVKTNIVTDLAQGLKGIWVFAEVFLFTLIGTSLSFNSTNGPLYGQRGLSSDQIKQLIGMMFIGIAGRLVALALSTAIVYNSFPPHRKELKWCGRFTLTCWFFQMPKATIQATLGAVAYTQHTIPGAIGQNRGLLIMQYTAFTVLIFAPLGSLLSVYVGGPMAAYLQELDEAANYKDRTGTEEDDNTTIAANSDTGASRDGGEDDEMHEMQTIDQMFTRARAMTVEMADHFNLHRERSQSGSSSVEEGSGHHEEGFIHRMRRNTLDILGTHGGPPSPQQAVHNRKSYIQAPTSPTDVRAGEESSFLDQTTAATGLAELGVSSPAVARQHGEHHSHTHADVEEGHAKSHMVRFEVEQEDDHRKL